MMAKRWMLRHTCTSLDEAGVPHLVYTHFALAVYGREMNWGIIGIARSYERARLND
jgi:hypothetical protein